MNKNLFSIALLLLLFLPSLYVHSAHCQPRKQKSSCEEFLISEKLTAGFGRLKYGESVRGRKINDSLIANNVVDVLRIAQGSFERFKDETLIDLGGMGPCVSVILYDRSGRYGYAGHFQSSYDGQEEMFSEAVKEFKDLSRTEVYVAGGSFSLFDSQDGVDEVVQGNWRQIIDLIKTNGFSPSNVFIRCGLDEGGSSLEFNSNNGSVILEKF